MNARDSLALAALLGAFAVVEGHAQTTSYPSPPKPLPEEEEIALAISAAPEEISAKADVYVLRGTDYVKVRSGTNGCACMVGRDLHPGSRYPICYDQESAKTSLRREIKESSLRAKGFAEVDVRKAVAAAYASGELQLPTKPAMAYMMSPHQVLFSSPTAEGVRVGAWSPHLMLMMPTPLTEQQLGLAEKSKVDVIQIRREGDHHAELVVKVPKWSTGKPAS